MNLALIGYRGTGKTTVARALAERLAWKAVDADVVLEERAGRSIKEIFAAEGEQAFRDLEALVVAELTAGDQQVLALGGGAVLRAENRQRIKAACLTAWLTASPDELEARIYSDPTTAARRPNLTAVGGRAEIERLLAERTPFYQECADITVATDGRTPQAIAAEILAALGPQLDQRA